MEPSGPFTEVKSDLDIKDFLYTVDGFHDALIKECRILASSYIGKGFGAKYLTPVFNIRMLIQTEWKDTPAIEIQFDGVKRFIIFGAEAIEGAKGRMTSSGIEFWFGLNYTDEHGILATSMRYRILDDRWWGPDATLGCENWIQEGESED